MPIPWICVVSLSFDATNSFHEASSSTRLWQRWHWAFQLSSNFLGESMNKTEISLEALREQAGSVNWAGLCESTGNGIGIWMMRPRRWVWMRCVYLGVKYAATWPVREIGESSMVWKTSRRDVLQGLYQSSLFMGPVLWKWSWLTKCKTVWGNAFPIFQSHCFD